MSTEPHRTDDEHHGIIARVVWLMAGMPVAELRRLLEVAERLAGERDEAAPMRRAS
jgi:hypothetical protein